MKYIIGLLIGISVTLGIVVIVLIRQRPNMVTVQPIITNTPQSTTQNIDNSPQEDETPASPLHYPSITMKLCYPSSFLPSGTIEVKSTTSNSAFSQAYAGTAGGEGSTFKISLPEGTYILRYKAVPDTTHPDKVIYGYYTDVCPTGVEPTCAASNPRKNKEVVVVANSETSGIALCDFYYDQNTQPSF